LEHKNKDFSKFPQAIVKSGLLAKLSNPAVRVYLVLLAHANYQTGLSYPTVKTISRLSGINKNLISKGLKELVICSLIDKFRGAKRFSYRNYYRIINMPRIILDAIPEKKRQPRKIFREKSGKFTSYGSVPGPVPSNMESLIPSFTESDTCPQDMDKKENINRDIY